MKKKLLPILLLSLYSGAAMAQATLTAATNEPIPGQVQVAYFKYSATDPGQSGANITWDFSDFQQSITDTMAYTACSANPNCGSFPNSTVAGIDHANNTTLFLNTDNNAETVVGAIEPTGATIPYTNGEDLFRFPITYNNSYVDTFSATFTSTMAYYRSGTVTVTCDGYGTLILPYGTINNVLRIHRQEIYQDSANLEGTSFIIPYQSDLYTWYSTSNRGELMDASSITIDNQQTSSYSYYTKQIATSVNNVNETAELNVFPNPAKDVVNVQFGNINGHVHISIADVAGREVAVLKDGNSNSQQVQYNISNLQPGLYFVRLQSDNGTITKKLEVL